MNNRLKLSTLKEVTPIERLIAVVNMLKAFGYDTENLTLNDTATIVVNIKGAMINSINEINK